MGVDVTADEIPARYWSLVAEMWVLLERRVVFCWMGSRRICVEVLSFGLMLSVCMNFWGFRCNAGNDNFLK